MVKENNTFKLHFRSNKSEEKDGQITQSIAKE